MNYKFSSLLWMIRILQRHYAWYKYVKYGLSPVNLSKFGFKKKMSWKYFCDHGRSQIFLWSRKMAKMEKNYGSNSSSWEVLLTTCCTEWMRNKLYKSQHISHLFLFGPFSFFLFPQMKGNKTCYKSIYTKKK